MDIDKVPQNKNNLHNGSYKTIIYAVDKDGNYVTAKTSGWEPEDIAHEQAWQAIEKRIRETKELVLQNKLSPIAYFMEKELLTPKRLSGFIGYSTRKIKRHLTPRGFSKISKEQLSTYANIFEITVDELINFNSL
jgi:hypothetical protein